MMNGSIRTSAARIASVSSNNTGPDGIVNRAGPKKRVGSEERVRDLDEGSGMVERMSDDE